MCRGFGPMASGEDADVLQHLSTARADGRLPESAAPDEVPDLREAPGLRP